MKSLDVKWPLQASHSSKVGRSSTENVCSLITGMTKKLTVANRSQSKEPFLKYLLYKLGLVCTRIPYQDILRVVKDWLALPVSLSFKYDSHHLKICKAIVLYHYQ